MQVAIDSIIAALEGKLRGYGHVAVAVSGGVDSMTLATLAARALRDRAEVYHAVSPAVPPEGTRRVKERAAVEGWRLQLVDAGEFGEPDYVANPVNRCFYCKRSLYSSIAQHTSAQIVSGTNADDLREYRPGLDAARDAGVQHPFAELGIGKSTVRAIARDLELGAVAELPASPCLASRVETGIAIRPELLGWIHACEGVVRSRVAAKAVRCRVRESGVVIEIDAESLRTLSQAQRDEITRVVRTVIPARVRGDGPKFAPYRTGSAFLTGND